MAHKNQDIILLKLRELRREELPKSALPIIDSIEDLVKEKPRMVLIPRQDFDNEPA
jgi:hypothetical protein